MLRALDKLPNHWLSITNEECIHNSRLNLACLSNVKEEDDENNVNNDDCNDVEFNKIGHYNNVVCYDNNRSMLQKDIDRQY